MGREPSRAEQFLATAALLRERYECAPALELPLLASVIAYLEAVADQERARAEALAPPEAAPPLPVEAPPAAPESVPGTFRETGWGGEVLRDDGGRERIAYSIMQAAGLRHGDRVRLHPKAGDPDHFRCVRTGETVALDPARVEERVADLRGDEGRWQAMIGDRLVRVRRARQMQLHPGDVVSLRYDAAELDGREGVAWVTAVHDVPPREASAPARRGAGRALRLRRAGLRSAPASAPPEDGAAGPPPVHLLIIGGHERARLQYRSALQTLAGVAAVDAVDGTRLTRSLKDRLAHAQAVILVTQHMSHTVSDYVTAQIRTQDIPYVWARSQNRSGLRRQVEEQLLPLLRPTADDRPAPEAG